MKLISAIRDLCALNRVEEFEGACLAEGFHKLHPKSTLGADSWLDNIEFTVKRQSLIAETTLTDYQSMFQDLINETDFHSSQSAGIVNLFGCYFKSWRITKDPTEMDEGRLGYICDVLPKFLEFHKDFLHKRMFLVTAYYCFLYFFVTKNTKLNRQPNIIGLLHAISHEVKDVIIDEECKNDLYSEALEYAMNVVGRLEQNKNYRKPIRLSDLFYNLKIQMTFSQGNTK